MDIYELTNLNSLIHEAITHLSHLGNHYETELVPIFALAGSILETSTESRQSRALILSAAHQRITQAEKKTIAIIIGDDPISTQQMSHLVRIRLICAKLIQLMADQLDELRTPVRRSKNY
ncbi:MAG: hypothetical protein GYA17_11935 [Chloroflexi bacterium]|jgi:hypothetical protein|nr:hypothetical protein [Anaerolineaceae bacterium]NMB89061.1 hypothetical protein [Chloroflexota bacterium]